MRPRESRQLPPNRVQVRPAVLLICLLRCEVFATARTGVYLGMVVVPHVLFERLFRSERFFALLTFNVSHSHHLAQGVVISTVPAMVLSSMLQGYFTTTFPTIPFSAWPGSVHSVLMGYVPSSGAVKVKESV